MFLHEYIDYSADSELRKISLRYSCNQQMLVESKSETREIILLVVVFLIVSMCTPEKCK